MSDSHDHLEAAEDLLATLRAAEDALRHLAAAHLPYPVLVRVHRNAARRAAALLARTSIGAGRPTEIELVAPPAPVSPPAPVVRPPREDDDEVLAQLLAAERELGSLSVADDPTEAPADTDEFVSTEDLVSAESPSLDDVLVSFDELEDARTEEATPDVPLVSFPEEEDDAEEDAAGFGYGDVATFEDDDGSTLIVDANALHPNARSAAPAAPRAVETVELASSTASASVTLGPPAVDALSDFDALLDEDEEITAVKLDPTRRRTEDAAEAVTPLAVDDLEILDEGVEEITFSGDFGDFAEELGDEISADEVILETRSAALAPTPAPLVRPLSASAPTIRDGTTPRPRAAAVRISADGDGQVLSEDEEVLEMAAAEDLDEDWEPDSDTGGFAVEVEVGDVVEDAPDGAVTPLELPPPPVQRAPELTAEDLAQLLARAQNAQHTGDLERAVALFSDVLDADPDHVEAHLGRGRIYLDIGDYARAMSDFALAEDLDPNSPEPQVAVGDLYFARKDYRKAIDCFNRALSVSPNHAMAICRRGISHYHRRNYPEALSDLQRAEKLDPGIPMIATYVGMAKKKARR